MIIARLDKWHLAAVLVFLTLAVITLRVFLFGNALFLYRDDVWSPDISEIIRSATNGFDLESARRLIYLSPFLALGYITDSSLVAEKGIFLFTRFLMGFSAYFVSYKLLSAHVSLERKWIFAISLLMGFFYAYNPFLTEKMGASIYGFTFSYALIPLVFYYFDKTLNEKGFVNIFLAAFLISLAVAGTTQFLVLLPLYLLLPWFAIVLGRKVIQRKQVSTALRNVGYLIGLFLLISSYWIFPAIEMSVSNKVPQPQQYVLTDLMLNSFSQKTTWMNGFRLMGAWWPYIDLAPIIDVGAWTALTFAIPAVMITSILLLRKNILAFYSLGFLAIILYVLFFYKGTHAPASNFYLNLYSMPLFGWMFRAPETSGIFLPFFYTMIVGIGVSTFVANGKKYSRYLRVMPLAVLVASICVISWPMFTGDFGGIFHNDNSFRNLDSTEIPPQTRIYQGNNIAIIGSSDAVNSLMGQGLLSSASNATMFLADNNLHSLTIPANSDWTILSSTRDLSMHFLPSSAIVIKPFDMTFTHDTGGQHWSRASTSDPLHGPFHPYLDLFGLKNNDSDYGQGLIFTWGKDSVRSSFNISNNDNYRMFVRLMRSPAGGQVVLTVDNKSFSLDSVSKQTLFEWHEAQLIDLKSGSHTIKIDNVRGFNVINLIVLVPSSQQDEWQDIVAQYANSTRLVYDLKPGLHLDNMAIETGRVPLFSEGKDPLDGKITRTFSIPEGSNQMSFEIRVNGTKDNTSQFILNKVVLEPDSVPELFVSDFEGPDINQWYNVHQDWLRVSRSSDAEALHGSASLRIDIAQGNREQWNVIETSHLIPIPPETDLKYSAAVSARNVNNLHSKVVYYDFAGVPLKEEILLANPEATYEEEFETLIHTPKEAAFIKLQFWVRTNPVMPSYYEIDNVSVNQEKPNDPVTIDPLNFSVFTDNQIGIDKSNGSLTLMLDKISSGQSGTILSSPIRVLPDRSYKVTFYVSGNALANLNIDGIYLRGISIDSRNDHEVFVAEKSIVSGSLELPASGYYTFAVKADACHSCKLRLTLDGISHLAEQRETEVTGSWNYFTTYLEEGRNSLAIYSEHPSLLKEILIYSSKGNETKGVLQLFDASANEGLVIKSQKVSDSLYVVHVKSPGSYVLDFEKKYDPFWVAKINDREFRPIRLLSGTIGYYIDKPGEYTIEIAYEVSTWLQIGWMITISTLLATVVIVTIRRQKLFAREQMVNARHQMTTARDASLFRTFMVPSLIFCISLVLLSIALLQSLQSTYNANQLMIFFYYSLIIALATMLVTSVINISVERSKKHRTS